MKPFYRKLPTSFINNASNKYSLVISYIYMINSINNKEETEKNSIRWYFYKNTKKKKYSQNI